MRILVVCSGNICRSPMAAAYLKHRATLAGLDHVRVDSAGTLGIENRPASPEAIEALGEIGLDLSGHRSKGILDRDLVECDAVIGMARHHLESVAGQFSRVPSVRWLLRAFQRGPRPSPRARELRDPIGMPIEAYRECLEIIRPCVDHLVEYLEQGGTGRDRGNPP